MFSFCWCFGSGWVGRNPTAVDVTHSFPQASALLDQASSAPGKVARIKGSLKCLELGWMCVPLALEMGE